MTDISTSRVRLSVSADTARRLSGIRWINKRRRGKARHLRFNGTRYDTSRLLLRAEGLGVDVLTDHKGRIRQRSLSGAGVSPPRMLFHRMESPRPDTRPLAGLVTDRNLVSRMRRWQLKPVFHYRDFLESELMIVSKGADIRLVISSGVLEVGQPGAGRMLEVGEVLLELVSGNPTGMYDLAIRISDSQDAGIAGHGIAETGYRLARPALGADIAKAGKPVLDAGMSAGGAFNAVMLETLTHLLSNQDLLLRGKPGAVHQTRVALRRMRAALRAFKNVLPYDKRKAFNGELRWFQQRLGGARDWQVFLTESLPRISRAHSSLPTEISRLKEVALRERRRATRDGVEVMETRRYSRLLLHMLGWLAELEYGSTDGPLDASLVPFARRVLGKTHRDLLSDRRPLSRMNPDELHSVRKRGKKARYAAEFFAPLWADADNRDLLRQLKMLQETLGDINDAVVARQLLVTLHPGRLPTTSHWVIQSWARDRIRQCLKKAQPHWRKLQHSPAFWEHAEPVGPTGGCHPSPASSDGSALG
jgi:CHAD domain-containing protein